ncbi:MAG: helix-turn-helix domain-containing protein [Ktedonobacteraceae bacterium]|nr:helix-turn-helix domain-containing protein [Ktedonobacteraceae bacterium]MBO0789485.1 helix-turn-helix domain-containing protein [Ktedonobacteraceae bacterium]
MRNHNEDPWFKRIKSVRYSLGWSQSEAAEHLGVDERTLRDWEAGRHVPNYASRKSLRDRYQKTLEELGLVPPP